MDAYTPVPVRVLAGIVMALALVAGTLAFGRLADDMNVAMGLTAAWFGAMFGAGVLLARRRRALLVPLALGFSAVAVASFLLLALPTLRDTTVDEEVATGTPARQSAGAGGGQAENVEISRGSFTSIAHPGRGTAAVVELADGSSVLTLTDFETDSGPDLRLYLSTGDPASGGELGDFEDLGGLKGNKGNQQYELPDDLDIDRFSNVVVWCRAFSVGFTSAVLEPS